MSVPSLKTMITVIVALTFMWLAVTHFLTNEQTYAIIFATFSSFLGFQQQKK